MPGYWDLQRMPTTDLLLPGLCHAHVFIFNLALLVCESNLIEVMIIYTVSEINLYLAWV